MTRELHAETDVQRAESTRHVPAEVLERGYEPRDAPARKVALGAGALFSLMLVGLLVAGVLLHFLRSGSDETAPPFADMRPVPPPPRLLEAEAPPLGPPLHPPAVGRSAPPAVEAAMRRVEEAGWGEDRPPPSAEEVAREHRSDSR